MGIILTQEGFALFSLFFARFLTPSRIYASNAIVMALFPKGLVWTRIASCSRTRVNAYSVFNHTLLVLVVYACLRDWTPIVRSISMVYVRAVCSDISLIFNLTACLSLLSAKTTIVIVDGVPHAIRAISLQIWVNALLIIHIS